MPLNIEILPEEKDTEKELLPVNPDSIRRGDTIITKCFHDNEVGTVAMVNNDLGYLTYKNVLMDEFYQIFVPIRGVVKLKDITPIDAYNLARGLKDAKNLNR